MIAQAIAACRARGRKIGICGQAPSDYPDFAQFLVEQGIDSISLNPDTVLKTTAAIHRKELDLKFDDSHELEQAIGSLRD
jgi:pyruvate,water dikinase